MNVAVAATDDSWRCGQPLGQASQLHAQTSLRRVTVSQRNRSFVQLARDELVFGKPFGEVQVSD